MMPFHLRSSREHFKSQNDDLQRVEPTEMCEQLSIARSGQPLGRGERRLVEGRPPLMARSPTVPYNSLYFHSTASHGTFSPLSMTLASTSHVSYDIEQKLAVAATRHSGRFAPDFVISPEHDVIRPSTNADTLWAPVSVCLLSRCPALQQPVYLRGICPRIGRCEKASAFAPQRISETRTWLHLAKPAFRACGVKQDIEYHGESVEGQGRVLSEGKRKEKDGETKGGSEIWSIPGRTEEDMRVSCLRVLATGRCIDQPETGHAGLIAMALGQGL
ncbi:hypothetical protein RRG08_002688 [Elysia crispata]|uniref:Uncharacterized protein n=1 Tax=Elysia crispata TaxID=231223 RepID=A0AAE1CML8_9GAST|nr:hypothetical protein RRG08_002688 [Elysia crispata]